ncbi:MAG: Chaperone protein DnaJ [Deltaproteobacteria bacterium ADurb.BinA179]|jgi:DnaJ-class molecular chaperone|nr:J domain-containing protein [Deltaproteobacteria bacterium]NLW68742.1 J domain-containing protein [Bacteriovoracaceae bacterium]OPZ26963.1 MAG: Chaperone protein DnaJ [Deltaproteobacteria bacterium ADurb.BinA179]HRR20125.1 DnaJ domain-containing protein [Desulfomonilia bacterium]HOS28130.1 DnaJ domain-containing protein [Deltaproteobacteria bacterium]
MIKDYYQILGICNDAGTEEIKRAYRRLAMRFHPDLNREDPRSVESFRDITEAYGVLIDPRKRKKYDGDRRRGFNRETVYRDIFSRSDFREVFDDLPIKGEWLEKLLMVSRVIAYEAIVCGGRPRDVLKRSLVRIAAQSASKIFHNVMDIHERIRIPDEIAAEGGSITIEYRPGFSKRRIRVNIPRCTKAGTVLKLVGMGRSNLAGKSGDLYLHVDIESS